MPSALLHRALQVRRGRAGPSAPACSSRPCRSRRWSTRSSARQADRSGRGEPAGPGPRHAVMALSNQHGHLVLASGNKSELAVGYSTIYGDAVGGFAPIKDVPKTLVWELARWRNADAERRGETAADPGDARSPSRRRPSCGPASSTPTRCRLRPARRHPRRLRRAGPRLRRAGRGRLRPRPGRAGAPADRHRRVQAPAVPARPEDLAARPSAATAGCRSPTAGEEHATPTEPLDATVAP